MEKQTFLMEVLDIADKRFGGVDSIYPFVQEAIRRIAAQGPRLVNIHMTNFMITVGGFSNITFGENTIRELANRLREEGFTVAELNGYYQVSW